MSKNENWVNINFNPYGRKDVSDCAIRAIVAATGLNYKDVCKKFNMAFAKGKGLVREKGINLKAIEKVFGDYCDIIEDYYANYNFVPDEMKGSKEDEEMRQFDLYNGITAVSGDTLNDFCTQFKDQGTFLVALDKNPEAKNPAARNGGHIVCVKLNKGAKRQGFIDTWDSGEMKVDTYMRVNKVVPKDSPLHWKYDKEKGKFIV